MKHEHGMTLVEVLIALGILGLVAGVSLSGLGLVYQSIALSQERVTAESLAKSQLEYIKSCPYDDINTPPQYSVDGNITIPAGYSIEVAAQHLDPEGDGNGNDDGLQKVTVAIKRDTQTLFTVEDYKMDR